jgi:hypothetical protein
VSNLTNETNSFQFLTSNENIDRVTEIRGIPHIVTEILWYFSFCRQIKFILFCMLVTPIKSQ